MANGKLGQFASLMQPAKPKAATQSALGKKMVAGAAGAFARKAATPAKGAPMFKRAPASGLAKIGGNLAKAVVQKALVKKAVGQAAYKTPVQYSTPKKPHKG